METRCEASHLRSHKTTNKTDIVPDWSSPDKGKQHFSTYPINSTTTCNMTFSLSEVLRSRLLSSSPLAVKLND